MSRNNEEFNDDLDFEDLSDEERELLFSDTNSSKINQSKHNNAIKKKNKKFKDSAKRYK